MNRPNILVISTDQHRADCLGTDGHPVVRTPNLDRLAAQGTRFDSAFCVNPVCMPSRASFLTARYPEVQGVQRNVIALPETEITLPAILKNVGYHTAALGKMHFLPPRTPYGFERMVLWEGGRLAEDDDYYKYLKPHGAERFANPWRKDDKSWEAEFQADPSPITPKLYRTAWVGKIAREFLQEEHDRPFFAWVSFPTPHHPFDPPAPYDTLYDPAAIPLPHVEPGELASKPSTQRQEWEQEYKDLTPERLRRVMAYYYGMITHVDDEVGTILTTLEETGLAANTLVIFLSDHGEAMGDHGLLLKGFWAYDGNIRIPLIMRWPGVLAAGEVRSELVEMVDLAPTILEAVGVPPHPGMQGRSLLPILRGEAPARESIYNSFGPNFKCIRTREHKLVYYPAKHEGELYDLVKDPGEYRNLWDDLASQSLKQQLFVKLLERLVAQEDPLPRPGTWGKQSDWPWRNTAL